MIRPALALIMFAHGVGYMLWFLPAWVPSAGLVVGRHWMFSSAVLITDPIGKVFGLVALAVLAGFVGAAWGLFARLPWWEPLAATSAAVGLLVLLVWWSVPASGSAIGALVVNLAILAGLRLPSMQPHLNRIIGG